MAQIAGRATISKALLLISTTNGNLIAIDGDSLIGESADASTTFGSIATDSTGVKVTKTFRFTMPRMTLAADVFARIEWEIVVASAGAPQGRINLDIKREGNPIAALVKASGAARNLAAAAETRYEEFLHVKIPAVDFNAGDRLDFAIEEEVTVASGAGGSTGEAKINHDPGNVNRRAVVEVNV